MAFYRRRHGLPTDPRTWLLVLIVMSPLFWDCYRQQSQTGIYIAECSGVVVSARPTLKSWIDFFDKGERHRLQGRHDGHYVAIIRSDKTHRRQKIAISESQYNAPLTGKQLTCSGGNVTIQS